MRGLILSLVALIPAPRPEDVLAPWASNRHPSDATKHHKVEITSGKHAYTVAQGGTMDGRNCRSPLGVGMSREGACEQTWESNRAVRMENVGETDVVNPWLSNGRNTFRSVDEIVSSAVAPGMTDAEKATAIWFQWITHRYHFTGGASGAEEGDAVKVFHVYGYNSCGSDSMIMAGSWRQAGLKSAPARGVGHCISQVFYDGRWHLFDGDMHAVYLLRDNETVAGEQDIVRDHDLIKRTHTQGILLPETRGSEESAAAIYGYEGEVGGQRDCYRDGSMKMVLRPGEALAWRWGHLEPIKYHGANRSQLYPDRICNGLWEYRPDFGKETWRKGASVEGVKSTQEGLAAEAGKTGTITWAMRAPYVIVGGRLATEGSGAEFSISWDGKIWENVTESLDKPFAFNPGAPAARYGYQLRCRLQGTARLKTLAILNDLQMAPLALPEMGVGQNSFLYTDESPGPRAVRITHDWVERSASKPPEAAPRPVYPPDQGEADGTDIVFRWTPPKDPDGDKISDYHFELSNRPDMRWPLSMSFYKLVSRTADAGKAQFSLPGAGLLAGDRRYYWHVRAKDEKGVWGPWSKVWSFTPRAPNGPLDVALECDPGKGTGILRWKPNPAGRKPVLYRVYGSDEKGFSISDTPYPVTLGICKELTNPFPENFIAETKAAELAVLGERVPPGQPFRTYYRVVAVDAQGKRSGPSDYVTAPRPVVYSKPVLTGKPGAPYRYPVLANRSLGDLRLRHVDSGDAASFWDLERPKYALERGPEWLKIDPVSGVLSGTPSAPGKHDVEVTVTIDREVRKLDPAVLQWGSEKVLSSTQERAGPATQRFSILVEK